MWGAKLDNVEQKVEQLLNGWAIKHDVPSDSHEHYATLLKEPLVRLYENVQSGERFSWMDELGIEAKDTISYVQEYAEDAYVNMHETHKNLKVIEAYLDQLKGSKYIEGLNALAGLAKTMGGNLQSANEKYSQVK